MQVPNYTFKSEQFESYVIFTKNIKYNTDETA